MVWPDGKPEKRSAGKERRRTPRLFSEGLQLRNRTGSMRQQTKEYPARGKDSGGVGGLQGKSRMRILASALGACLTRQAGFAAARPAASGGLWQAVASKIGWMVINLRNCPIKQQFSLELPGARVLIVSA